jgi:hypothetical protein
LKLRTLFICGDLQLRREAERQTLSRYIKEALPRLGAEPRDISSGQGCCWRAEVTGIGAARTSSKTLLPGILGPVLPNEFLLVTGLCWEEVEENIS